MSAYRIKDVSGGGIRGAAYSSEPPSGTACYYTIHRTSRREYWDRCWWDTESCEHCTDVMKPTRQDPTRGWICRECDAILDGYRGERRRKEDR